MKAAHAGVATLLLALPVGGATGAPTTFHIVTNYNGASAYLFDGADAHARTYATVTHPQYAAVSPDGEYAAVTSPDGKASIINLVTHAVTDFDYSAGGLGISQPIFSTDGDYAFLPQRVTSGSPPKAKIHRVDLRGTTPLSQTAEVASITSCGSPTMAIRRFQGSDQIWVGCYTAFSLTPLTGLYTPTFAPVAGTALTVVQQLNDIEISPSGTTAYLAQRNNLAKIDLGTGVETNLYSAGISNCMSLLVDSADAYVYGGCGTFWSGMGIQRVATTGGPVANNQTNSALTAFQIAFNADGTQIWQPDVGNAQFNGTQVQVWTTSQLSGSAAAQTRTSSPPFAAPSGIAFGIRPNVPDAPTAVSATAGNGSAVVTWIAPTSDGGASLTGYTVTASPGGATCSSTPPQTTCTVSGLVNGTAYTFSATATNSVGSSPASTASSAVTPSAPAPEAQKSNAAPGGSGGGGGTNPATLSVTGVARSIQVASATITSRVTVNGAGTVRQVGTQTRSDRAMPCTASRVTPEAGTYRMTCMLGRAARAELTRRSATVRLTTTFTPVAGASVSRTTTVRLKRIPAPRLPVTG